MPPPQGKQNPFSDPEKGGKDPVAFIRRYGKRIRQIHIKDIADLSNYETTTELGKSVVDLPGS